MNCVVANIDWKPEFDRKIVLPVSPGAASIVSEKVREYLLGVIQRGLPCYLHLENWCIDSDEISCNEDQLKRYSEIIQFAEQQGYEVKTYNLSGFNAQYDPKEFEEARKTKTLLITTVKTPIKSSVKYRLSQMINLRSAQENIALYWMNDKIISQSEALYARGVIESTCFEKKTMLSIPRKKSFKVWIQYIDPQEAVAHMVLKLGDDYE